MPRRQHGELVPLDPEIERTIRRRRRGRGGNRRNNMAAPPPPPRENLIRIADDKDRGIRDYATPEFAQLNSGILAPEITNLTFEPKPLMFTMLQTMGQFGGLKTDDPHLHLKSYLKIVDAFKINGVTPEIIRLTLFT